MEVEHLENKSLLKPVFSLGKTSPDPLSEDNPDLVQTLLGGDLMVVGVASCLRLLAGEVSGYLPVLPEVVLVPYQNDTGGHTGLHCTGLLHLQIEVKLQDIIITIEATYLSMMHSVVDVLVSNVGSVVAGPVGDAVQQEDHVGPSDHMVQLFTHQMNILTTENLDGDLDRKVYDTF